MAKLMASSSWSATGNQVHHGLRRGVHRDRRADPDESYPGTSRERYRRKLITGERHLHMVLDEHVDHYNVEDFLMGLLFRRPPAASLRLPR
jgi:hypothetical protein